MQRGRRVWLLIICFLLIPSMSFAGISFLIDMDPSTPDVFESDLWLFPGDSFTTNVVVILDSDTDSLSSFSYSLWWDDTELSISGMNNISTYPLESTWQDLLCHSMSVSGIFNCGQINILGHSEGPLTSVVTTIEWTADNPVTDDSLDMGIYFHSGDFSMGIMPDGAFDKNASPVSVSFGGGSVHLAPEPVSSILFLTGGATLGLKRYWSRKRGTRAS